MENNVQINVGVNEVGGSVKSIRQELREAQQNAVQMSRAFGENSVQATEAAKRVAKLRDEIEDVGIKIKGLNPDKFQRIASIGQGVAQGFVAAQGAMALFGSESKDLEKTMVKLQGAIALSQGLQGLKDLKLALSGVSIYLKLAMVAVALLVANFDKLKAMVYNLIPGLETFTKWLGGIVNKITDFVGITSEAQRTMDELTKSNKSANDESERQIAILEAQGASAEKIYWKKKELWAREIGELETKKKLGLKLTEEETKKMYDLWTQYYVDSAARDKRIREEQLAAIKKAEEDKRKAFEDAQKKIIEDSRFNDELEKARLKEREEWVKHQTDLAIEEEKRTQDEVAKLQKEADDKQKEKDAKKIEDAKRAREEEFKFTLASIEAIQSLNDLAYANKLAKVQKGSKEEEALLKKQFEDNKKMNIATAIINGAQAIMSILAQHPKFDGGIGTIAAIASAGVTTLAQIAKIKATKFETTSAPQAGTYTPPSSTSINTPIQQQRSILGTQTGATGQNQVTKVIVTETDITRAQGRVNDIRRRALIH